MAWTPKLHISTLLDRLISAVESHRRWQLVATAMLSTLAVFAIFGATSNSRAEHARWGASSLVLIATSDLVSGTTLTEANTASIERDEKETAALAEAYGKGATGRGMATGGSKAIKELEKEQKTRSTRMVRDGLDAALLDIATFYRDVMMVQAGSNDGLINKELENEIHTYAANNKPAAIINKINAIMEARVNLGHNAAPLLTVEALMCVLAR